MIREWPRRAANRPGGRTGRGPQQTCVSCRRVECTECHLQESHCPLPVNQRTSVMSADTGAVTEYWGGDGGLRPFSSNSVGDTEHAATRHRYRRDDFWDGKGHQHRSITSLVLSSPRAGTVAAHAQLSRERGGRCDPHSRARRSRQCRAAGSLAGI
jgi:hypothetical protein